MFMQILQHLGSDLGRIVSATGVFVGPGGIAEVKGPSYILVRTLSYLSRTPCQA
jgi:hypothetical protein